MKTVAGSGMLEEPRGKQAGVSLGFELVREVGRTLFLEQRSVAFGRQAGEHEKECLIFLSRPARRQKERVCRYYIRAAAGSMSTRTR
jgi:hypothetical protein